MQIVDDKHGSPDVKTICYSNDNHSTFDFLEVQYVEVVQYEEHSLENLISFIERTKFSDKKAYDKDIHILCHLGNETKIHLPDHLVLQQQVSQSKINCPVLFMGSPDSVPDSVYCLLQLYPTIRKVIEFDLQDEYLKNYQTQPGVMYFKRGKKAPLEKRDNEKHYPFENLGFTP